MNESGDLNLSRFQIYLTELSKYDYDRFQKEQDESEKYGTNPKRSELDRDQVPNMGFSAAIMEKLMITPPIIPKKESNGGNESDSNGQMIDYFISQERKSPNDSSPLSDDVNPPVYPDADDDAPLSDSEHDSDNDNQRKKYFRIPSKLSTNANEDFSPALLDAFRQHKNHYYRSKMRTGLISSEQLQMYVQQYIEALQWVLKYYYQGCPSWSWFYPHHYAPYLSDLNNFKHLQFTFQKGTPFKPFEQLLGMYSNLCLGVFINHF